MLVYYGYCCCVFIAAAPAPESNGCLMALANMSECLTYVEDGSKLSKPDKGCCPELAGLVDSNPICLCEMLGKPDSIGIKIDLNKALKLPSVCGVTTPPVSTCSGKLQHLLNGSWFSLLCLKFLLLKHFFNP